MSRICRLCRSKDFEEDRGKGTTSCMKCGYVIEECQIVSEIQFYEAPNGIQLVGQFIGLQVSHGREKSRARPPNEPKYTPREVFIFKCSAIMKEIGEKMKIKTDHIGSAADLFKICVEQNLATTFDKDYIIVICLCIICRLLNTKHLLSDFGKEIKADMQELERGFDFLVHYLNIDLPIAEGTITGRK